MYSPKEQPQPTPEYGELQAYPFLVEDTDDYLHRILPDGFSKYLERIYYGLQCLPVRESLSRKD